MAATHNQHPWLHYTLLDIFYFFSSLYLVFLAALCCRFLFSFLVFFFFFVVSHLNIIDNILTTANNQSIRAIKIVILHVRTCGSNWMDCSNTRSYNIFLQYLDTHTHVYIHMHAHQHWL